MRVLDYRSAKRAAELFEESGAESVQDDEHLLAILEEMLDAQGARLGDAGREQENENGHV